MPLQTGTEERDYPARGGGYSRRREPYYKRLTPIGGKRGMTVTDDDGNLVVRVLAFDDREEMGCVWIQVKTPAPPRARERGAEFSNVTIRVEGDDYDINARMDEILRAFVGVQIALRAD